MKHKTGWAFSQQDELVEPRWAASEREVCRGQLRQVCRVTPGSSPCAGSGLAFLPGHQREECELLGINNSTQTRH